MSWSATEFMEQREAGAVTCEGNSGILMSTQAGAHHDPGFFPELLGTTAFSDETRLEFVMQVLRPKALKAWNRDCSTSADLDAILVPAFFHTPTMACGAAKHLVPIASSTWRPARSRLAANFSAMDNVMPSHMNKHVPLPKIMVPVGKDGEGKPVALRCLRAARDSSARAYLAHAFDDDLLRGLDVLFSSATSTCSWRRWSPRIPVARVAPEMVARTLSG